MVTKGQIERLLEEKVRPALHVHEGDIRLNGYDNGIVSVTLLGACSGCPSADLSTKAFVEDVLKEAYPEIGQVELYQETSSELMNIARKLMSK